MSFTLVRKVDPDLVDARFNYKQIGEELLTAYYNSYDSNITGMSHIFHSNAQFTFRGYEFFGFNNWLELLKRNNIYKFTHHIMHSIIQPLSKSELLVITNGTLSVNNTLSFDKFTETLIIKRDTQNKFCITNVVFCLIE